MDFVTKSFLVRPLSYTMDWPEAQEAAGCSKSVQAVRPCRACEVSSDNIHVSDCASTLKMAKEGHSAHNKRNYEDISGYIDTAMDVNMCSKRRKVATEWLHSRSIFPYHPPLSPKFPLYSVLG
jgi:hypothetical protein